MYSQNHCKRYCNPLLGLTVKYAMYRNVRKRHGVVLRHQTQKVARKLKKEKSQFYVRYGAIALLKF